MKKPYIVRLQVEGYIEYMVGNCNSPEEAELVAQELYQEDLEEGAVPTTLEIVDAEAIVDEEKEEEEVN